VIHNCEKIKEMGTVEPRGYVVNVMNVMKGGTNIACEKDKKARGGEEKSDDLSNLITLKYHVCFTTFIPSNINITLL
jgi:hypothetical protein